MSLFDANWSTLVQKLLPPSTREVDFIEVSDDFKTGDPENQYIYDLLVSSPGHWKEFPTIGVGIWKYLQDTVSPQEIQRAIKVQLTNDVFDNPLVDARKFPTIIVNSVVVELS